MNKPLIRQLLEVLDQTCTDMAQYYYTLDLPHKNAFNKTLPHTVANLSLAMIAAKKALDP